MKPLAPTPSANPLPLDAIGIAEAAALLGVAPCSMWRWAIRDGTLRAWRVGGRWRLSRSEVLGLVGHNKPRPEVQVKADREAELLEVDRVLKAEGVRR